MKINISNSIQTAPGGAAPQIQTLIQKGGKGNIIGQDGGQGNLAGITAKKCGCPNESPSTHGPQGTQGSQPAQDKGMQELKDLLGKAVQMLKQIISQLEAAKGGAQKGGADGAEKGAPKGPEGAEGAQAPGEAGQPAGGAEAGKEAGGAEEKKDDDPLGGILEFLSKLLDILKQLLPQLQQLFQGGAAQQGAQAAEAA
jgi:hypothetical protein